MKVFKLLSIVMVLAMILLFFTGCSFSRRSDSFIYAKPSSGTSQNAGSEYNDTNIVSEYMHIKDNYYSFVPRSGGNETIIIWFTDIKNDSICIEYYSHDLGNYGRDVYDHEIKTIPMTYDEKNSQFEFEFCGNWRLTKSSLQYNRYLIHQYHNEDFKRLTPIKPSDYWWWEEAKRQTGNYNAHSSITIENAQVGSLISFGKFEMDNDESNGADSITWEVIDKNENGIMVISKYCLCCQETSESYTTWENSVTRKWLNDEFYNQAFSTSEKAKIQQTRVVNDDNQETGMPGGNDTNDYLFLLSINEVEKYLLTENRIAYATLYAQKSVDEDGGAFNWWLRTPGKKHVTISGSSIQQSYVGGNGFLYTEGTTTDVYNGGIRPAMWISK